MTPHRPRATLRQRPARGAALLVAMVLLTLVATLAAGMVWQQWRAVEVEIAERGRSQIGWIMNGALDWARLILREDALNTQRRGIPTSLNEPWATPLAEARLSTFLSKDAANTEGGPEAFLGGAITDAQARFNLRNLVEDGKVTPEEVALLKNLCRQAGLSEQVAEQLAEGLQAARTGTDAAAPLMPMRVDDLVWLGLDSGTVERLRPLVTVLPRQTLVNVNTASREVLAAVVEGLDLGTAERLVQARQRTPFKTLADAQAQLPAGITLKETVLSVKSDFFEVRGRMRLDDRALEELSLMQRNGLEVTAVQRQRVHSVLPSGR
ncbi:MAG: type II secretion system minor pseudopilin GspK [Burkholderiales bacterium]|nr:type II secretion system minor pseudopilin GspK [Burkholderiales bacterium]